VSICLPEARAVERGTGRTMEVNPTAWRPGLALAHRRRCARRLEGPLWSWLLGGNLPGRMSGFGAQQPVADPMTDG